MFSISKAFRVLALVLAAVLVPATALAGTTGFTTAKQGQAARPTKTVKLKKADPAKANKAKANKANKDKAANRASKVRAKASQPNAGPKLKIRKQRKH